MTTERIRNSKMPSLFREWKIDTENDDDMGMYEIHYNNFVYVCHLMALGYVHDGNHWDMERYQKDWDKSAIILSNSIVLYDRAHDHKVKGEYPPFDVEVVRHVRECCIMLGEIRAIILKNMQRLENGQRQQR